MRLLVVGGLGYIGAKLTKHLYQLGHQVFIGSQSNHKNLLTLPNVKVLNFNLFETLPFDNRLKDFDLVIHAAGINSTDSEKNPELAHEYNGNLTNRILQSAISQGVKRYIYLSTAHVYNRPLVGNYSELSKPINKHPYALTHLEGERHILDAHQEKRIHGIVLRISNTFGPPLSPLANCWMLVINDLCLQAKKFKKLVLKSDGNQVRNFITMEDTINAINFFTQLPEEHLSDGLFNLGSDFTSSIINIAEIITERCENILGFRPEIIKYSNDSNRINLPLYYNIQKLKKTGFILKNKTNAEIDKLLLFCDKNHNLLKNY